MTTLVDIDGFSHQRAAAAQAGSGFIGTYDVVNRSAGITFDTSNKRLASHFAALKVVEDGVSATNVGRVVPSAGQLFVASFYVRIDAAPSIASMLFTLIGPTNSGSIAMNTSGQLVAQFVGGTLQHTSASFADGAWHRIDLRIETSGSTYTLDWQVDGSAQTQATRTGQSAANMTAWRLGSTQTSHTLTCLYSDFVLSATTGDYAIGDHVVLPLYPDGDGTHNLNGHVSGEGGETTSLYQHVDDWNGGTPDTATYVRQPGSGSGDYAEFTMSAPLSVHSTIWGVLGIVAGFASGTTANNADTQVLDAHGGTVLDHIGNLIDYSGSTTIPGFYRQFLAAPGGGWTNSNLAGVVVEWGFSTNVATAPRLTAVLLEYAAPYVASTVDQDADAIVQKTTAVAQSADAVIKAQPTRTHGTDADLKKTLTKSQSADAVIAVIVHHDTDAIVKKTVARTHGADAQILGITHTVTHSTDARITGAQSKTHSTDAIIGDQDTTIRPVRRHVVWPP